MKPPYLAIPTIRLRDIQKASQPETPPRRPARGRPHAG
jgi:hypothetical protein